MHHGNWACVLHPPSCTDGWLIDSLAGAASHRTGQGAPWKASTCASTRLGEEIAASTLPQSTDSTFRAGRWFTSPPVNAGLVTD